MKFNRIKSLVFALGASFTAFPSLAVEPLSIEYVGFNVIMDCEANLPVFVSYNATKDTGNEKRSSSFYLDPEVPKSCQQISTDSYKIPYEIYVGLNKKISYDRGHITPANHMDGNKVSIKQTNFMTNIVPMTRTTNRTGAWRETEKITECLRDTKDFKVMAGVIVGNDTRDNYFVSSHGVATPDFLWKVLFDGENIISWIIPNSHNAIKENLPNYQTSVSDIEDKSGLNLPIPSHMKAFTHQSEWNIPKYCDFS
jgi:endonuclease G